MHEHLEFNSDAEAFSEKRLFRNRLIFAMFFVLALFSVLIGRMAYLQWFDFERYHLMAEDNRISVETIPPTRGKIYDRNHILLADNQPVFTLKFTREKIEDMDLVQKKIAELLPDFTEERRDKFFEKLKKTSRSKTILLPYSLTEKEAAQFAVQSYDLPGVVLTARLKRTYPFGATGVHAIGYVGRINMKELTNLNESDYRGTDVIGKLGIERYYEDKLHGKPGIQQVETNARGRVLRKLETTPSIPGEDIQLTLDIKLQQYAESLFKNHKRGSIVAIDPKNGEVLAYVSVPTFDPNLFVDGIDQASYRALLKNPNKPFINRGINGKYPPGSTIKPFVALGAIERNIISPNKKIYDPGYFEYMGHRYRDWKRTGHGLMDMEDAITQSCDTYFYELSLDMGIDTIHDSMAPFGFGSLTGIDIPGESKGILPSQKWKRETKDLPWYRGETIISSIGQGYNLATPVQLAKATAILANGGKIIQPHLLRSAELEPPKQIEIKDIKNWERVIKAMRNVMHGARGTARRHGVGLPFKMAGKTGTAQVFSLNESDYEAENIDKSLHDHSLFIGFAPLNDPKIAVAVIVENGGSGSRTAAPMGVDVIKKYLEHTP
ncbi:penicillin-binding protein 2 [Thiomicrorhabdus sp. ZW0627]|uniref:penicillin-binding protein 2 n=1 Tax=Thiomicrorhabdus sp. ZW0627 TaxID=3039774 RepID=UPI0024365E8E|nr:penicillin-binding protein 2 [Thiomicrorhabdus sp. ZW0627]MDG6773500.1 penicillin-binding protein 2 [Thiomicrorhabdus sp. ZW0627]